MRKKNGKFLQNGILLLLVLLFAGPAPAGGYYENTRLRIKEAGRVKTSKNDLIPDPIIQTAHLEVGYTQKLELVWTDSGSGATGHISVYRPKLPDGWVCLGHLALGHRNKPDQPLPIAKYSRLYLYSPEKYEAIHPIDANEDATFFRPIIPDKYSNYMALGHVVAPGYYAKGTIVDAKELGENRMYCVKKIAAVRPGRVVGLIWKGEGASNKLTKATSVWSMNRWKDGAKLTEGQSKKAGSWTKAGYFSQSKEYGVPANTFLALRDADSWEWTLNKPWVLVAKYPADVRKDVCSGMWNDAEASYAEAYKKWHKALELSAKEMGLSNDEFNRAFKQLDRRQLIKSGEPFRVRFKENHGSIKGGEVYTVSYCKGLFTATGINAKTGNPWTYQKEGGDPDKWRMNVWGYDCTFDQIGRVMEGNKVVGYLDQELGQALKFLAVTDIRKYIKSGGTFKVRFKNDHAGTIAKGKNYTVSYKDGLFTATGFNRKTEEIYTTTAGGNPNKWEMNVWGYDCTFDALGHLLKKNSVVGKILWCKGLGGGMPVAKRALAHEKPAPPAEPGKQEIFPKSAEPRRKIVNVTFEKSDFDKIRKELEKETSVLLASLPGFKTFGMLKEANIENVTFLQGEFAKGKEKNQPWMAIIGDTDVTLEKVGKVKGKIIALLRLYVEHGLRTAFVVLTDPETLTKQVKSFSKKPLKGLKFSDCAAVFANEQHEWQMDEFPDPVKDKLEPFILSDAGRFDFQKGETMLLTAELKKNAELKEPFELLKAEPPKVLFTGLFPQKKGGSFKLRARLLTEYNIKYFPQGLEADMPVLEITAGEPHLSLLSNVHFDLTKYLKGDVPLRVNIPASGFKVTVGVTATAQIPGEWENPFGFPMTVSDVKLSATLGVTPDIGLSGKVDLNGKSIEMTGAFLGGALVALQGKLKEVEFKDVALFAQLTSPGGPFTDFTIKNFELAVSSVDNNDLNLHEGTTVNGDLYLKTTCLGSLRLTVYDQQGVICQGWCKPIQLGPISISGEGPDGEIGTSDDGPEIDLKYWPVNKPPYNLEQSCYISGTTSLPAATLDAFLDLQANKLELELDGELGGLFQTRITAQGNHDVLTNITNGGAMKFNGEFGQGFQGWLKETVLDKVGGDSTVADAAALIGGTMLSINSATISGSLKDLANGKITKLTLKGSAFGIGFKVGPTDVDSTDYSDLVDKVKAEVITAAKDRLKNPLKGLPLPDEIKEPLKTAFHAFMDYSPVGTVIDHAADAAKAAAEGNVEAVGEIAADMAKAQIELAKRVIEAIEDAINEIADFLGL